MEMLGRVFISGRVAAPHMAANQTQTQVDPGVPGPQALFASAFVRVRYFDFIQMRAGFIHVPSFPDPNGK